MEYSEETYELLFNNQLQICTLIVTIFSTILWGIYVYFTIKTFNQIKKQTDLQSRAFLLVTPKICALHDDVEILDTAKRLQEKWYRILENNLTVALTENRIFEFELTNRGKSDIINWLINISIEINEGEYLNRKFAINGECLKMLITSKSDQTIAPNQTIKVPVILVGDFPNISFNWSISYKDLMDGEYITNSKNGFSISNLIALNYKE